MSAALVATALLATELAMPVDVTELRAADLDQDGRDELIVVSQQDRGANPDAVTLTTLYLDASGRELRRETLELGNRPMLWDVQGGIWAIDAQGLAELSSTGRRQIATLQTPLTILGPTTPAAADIAHDLDHDGVADIIAFSRGALYAVAADGRRWGTVAAPATGVARTQSQAGGITQVTATMVPPVAVGDVDGDGMDDLLLPAADQVRVAFTGDTLGARIATLPLPFDLDPPPQGGAAAGDAAGDAESQKLANAWFQDLTGDGKVDLLVQHAVSQGSWFGSTATLSLCAGTGSSFDVTQTLQTSAAVVDLLLVDFEGDGDTDLLVSEIDANMGNLATALVSKTVKIQPWLYVMEGGRYAPPVALDRLKVPIDQGDRFQTDAEHDLTGDGIVDLVTNAGQDMVYVRAGEDHAFASDPVAQLAVQVPAGGDTLFVHDLTGDGRAEIVVWGPGRDKAQLLRMP